MSRICCALICTNVHNDIVEDEAEEEEYGCSVTRVPVALHISILGAGTMRKEGYLLQSSEHFVLTGGTGRRFGNMEEEEHITIWLPAEGEEGEVELLLVEDASLPEYDEHNDENEDKKCGEEDNFGTTIVPVVFLFHLTRCCPEH